MAVNMEATMPRESVTAKPRMGPVPNWYRMAAAMIVVRLESVIEMLALLKESGKKASEVFGACPRYPQVLINIPVANNDVKKAVMASAELAQAVAGEEEKLGDEGRVLVRPSGTEALMRVMVEAKTQQTAQEAAQRLADLIAKL